MATRNIVPRANEEGGIGTAAKKWASGWIKALTVTTINALTLAAAAVGFTIAGGTTPKTLTVDETVAMSDKAPKANPVFTGDVTLSGNVVNPTLPAFLAKLSTVLSNVTGDGTGYDVIFDTEIFDQGANYNNATGLFTAPISGIYRFAGTLWLTGVAANHTVISLSLTVGGKVYYARDFFSVVYDRVISVDVLAPLNVLQTASLNLIVYNGSKTVGIYGDVGNSFNSYFFGKLEC